VKLIKKIGVILLLIISLSAFLSGCQRSDGGQPDAAPVFTSFRDIPGVTQEEIDAIEAIKAQRDSFVYGMTSSTEAFMGINGEIRGYTALITEWLTELFGVKFEPRLVEWSKFLAALESHETDFTGDLVSNEARRQIYFMTEHPINVAVVKGFRLANSVPLPEIAQTRPLRLGFVEGTSMIGQVCATMKDGTYEVVFVSDAEPIYQALKSGEIDIFYNVARAEAAFIDYAEIVPVDFFPLIYSPVSLSTQNPDLKPIVDVVNKALSHGAIRSHLSRLYNQGYEDYLRHKFFMQLTEEELAFIKANPVIAYVSSYNNYPTSFYTTRYGEWRGISHDVLREIELLTGLKFEIVNGAETRLGELTEMLEGGCARMITSLAHSQDREGRFLWAELRLLGLISRLFLNRSIPISKSMIFIP